MKRDVLALVFILSWVIAFVLPVGATGIDPIAYVAVPESVFTPIPAGPSPVIRIASPVAPLPIAVEPAGPPRTAMHASPRPSVPQRPTVRPTRASGVVAGIVRVSGVATWYCEPGVSPCTSGYPWSGAYGAAGPALRAALGNWRGRTVHVNGVAVTLIDFCQCGGNHVIDVYHATWLTIPHPDSVTIRW